MALLYYYLDFLDDSFSVSYSCSKISNNFVTFLFNAQKVFELKKEDNTVGRRRKYPSLEKEPTELDKIIKRKQSSKILAEYKDTKWSKEEIKRTYYLSSGISQENAKEITKEIKSYNKKIQTTIQGPVVRVAGKKKDELQEIMLLVKEMNKNFPVSFTNFKD